MNDRSFIRRKDERRKNHMARVFRTKQISFLEGNLVTHPHLSRHMQKGSMKFWQETNQMPDAADL
jgi:hypothetical protein